MPYVLETGYWLSDGGVRRIKTADDILSNGADMLDAVYLDNGYGGGVRNVQIVFPIGTDVADAKSGLQRFNKWLKKARPANADYDFIEGKLYAEHIEVT